MTLFRVVTLGLLMLFFSGCGSTTNLNPLRLLTENSWILSTMNGNMLDPGTFGTNLPTLDFLEGGNLAGFSGCNNFSGDYILQENGIQLSTGAMTKKACPGSGESAFISALEKVTNFRVEKEKLTLLDGVTELMSFIPLED